MSPCGKYTLYGFYLYCVDLGKLCDERMNERVKRIERESITAAVPMFPLAKDRCNAFRSHIAEPHGAMSRGLNTGGVRLKNSFAQATKEKNTLLDRATNRCRNVGLAHHTSCFLLPLGALLDQKFVHHEKRPVFTCRRSHHVCAATQRRGLIGPVCTTVWNSTGRRLTSTFRHMMLSKRQEAILAPTLDSSQMAMFLSALFFTLLKTKRRKSVQRMRCRGQLQREEISIQKGCCFGETREAPHTRLALLLPIAALFFCFPPVRSPPLHFFPNRFDTS